jgi:diguanylate cyclase (GGDEF)-like protein
VTTALAAITAALATLVVVLAIVLVLRRPREAPARARENRPSPSPPSPSPPSPSPPSPAQVPAVVEAAPLPETLSDGDTRLELMVRELSQALERAEYENRRGRFLAQLAGALDLDDVLGRTLEAAHGLPGIDSAMIVLPQGDEGPLVATHGMSREEALGQPIAPTAEGRQPRAVSLNYRYAEPDVGIDGNLIRGGLMMPLVGLREQFIGTLAVFWRGRERDVASEEVELLQELAATAGPAIENAKRYLEARQLAEMDALTGLHNRRYFDDVLGREIARANRYERSLALLLLDLDDFKEVNDRVGHLGGDAVLADIGGRVRETLRSADIACRVGGDELAVILPEATIQDAEQLYGRLLAAVNAHPLAGGQTVTMSGGVAAATRDDDAESLFKRADEALYRAKRDGKGHVR